MGTEDRALIIAEIGVNHNGSVELAKRIIDAIVDCDVDVIKFQTGSLELLMVEDAPKAKYQADSTGHDSSAWEMIKNIRLEHEDFVNLKDYVESRGKIFLSTAFDRPSFAFLSDLGLTTAKIPSGEITNLPYIRDVARGSNDIILSTGMSELHEVEAAVLAICETGFSKSRITVLQCNTAYPSPLADTNLRAMVSMGNALGVRYGYSDHTEGSTASIAAVALGASVIEKHVTLDRTLPGPDQKASMEPEDFKQFVRALRDAELVLGSDAKSMTESEKANRKVARRGLYAARSIPRGVVIDNDDVVALRPESDVSPMRFDEVIGHIAIEGFERHEPIRMSQIQAKEPNVPSVDL